MWLDPGTGSEKSPPCIVVYDQVETLDATWPVELHWHAMKKPEHVAGNHWTFTDDREVININYWDWEPKYRSGTGYISGTVSPVPNRQYQYDGTLHLQLWNGTKTLNPTVADSICTYDANLVYEDGVLAGHEPLNFALFNGGKQSGECQVHRRRAGDHLWSHGTPATARSASPIGRCQSTPRRSLCIADS